MDTQHQFRTVKDRGVAQEVIDGPGLTIQRTIPLPGLPAIGPFILLDHFGPVELPVGASFPPNPHPHAGMETLTYLLDGSADHRDSAGHRGTIFAGEAQWMRAGRGIIHDEAPGPTLRADGGVMQVLQLWINLPKGRKHTEPAFAAYARDRIPELALGDGTVRVIAGEVEGARGPVTTFADPFAVHLRLPAGGTATLPVPPGIELGVYVAGGVVRIGGGHRLDTHEHALLDTGNAVTLAADSPADLLVLGGPPLDAPLVRQGPFVMNSRDEIDAAFADFHAGHMGTL
jgi:Pirin-related protein